MRLDYIWDNCYAPAPNQAAYFAEGNGDMGDGDCVVHYVGQEYNTANAMGLANDTISSVLRPQNVFITLCKDNDYPGGCRDFGSATQTLPMLSNMPDDWNDAVSSIKIHN